MHLILFVCTVPVFYNILVNCVDLACQQKVPLSSLLSHLDSDHETEDFVREIPEDIFIVNRILAVAL